MQLKSDLLKILTNKKWRAGFRQFLKNKQIYNKLNTLDTLKFHWRDAYFKTYEQFDPAGYLDWHYFWQDIWAERHVYNHPHKEHVDLASRIDGFVSHVMVFKPVKYIDIRPLPGLDGDNLEFVSGSIHAIPYLDSSVHSLSCLHVIEHIGLGRYGDTVDPQGHIKAAKELGRVLAPKGMLLIGTPVGKERLCFDAHRVFDPQTIIDLFAPLRLKEFSLIDDFGQGIQYNASLKTAQKCTYGCGLFYFQKNQ